MNSRERIYAAICGKATDKIPVVPQITYFTSDISDVKWEQAMNDPKVMAFCLWQGAKRFGYDGVYAGWESSFNLMANAMGARMVYHEGTIPYIEGPLFTTPQQIHKIQIPDPYKNKRLALHLKATSILRDELDSNIPLFSYVPGPLTVAGLLMGNENLMKNILLSPYFIHEVVKQTTEATLRYALAKIKSGAEIIVVAEPSASTSLISPSMFQEFSKPSLKLLVQAIQEEGGTPSIHICGKTLLILDSICEIAPKIIEIDAENDMAQAREIVKDKVCLQGNLHTTDILMLGNPEKVYAECVQTIKKGVYKESYFILSSGCEVPNGTPARNIDAMVMAGHGELAQNDSSYFKERTTL